MAGPTINKQEAVLVLGQNNRQAVSIIRSLGRAGYRVVVGRGDLPGVAERSRFVDEIWVHPSIFSGDREFLDALNGYVVDRGDIGFIFPSDDHELAILARNASALPTGVTMVMPDPSAVLAFQDKVTATALAVELGLPVAPYRVVADVEKMTEALGEIGLPSIVKPTAALRPLYGRKAVICTTEDDARIFSDTWPKGHDSLIVQAYVMGIRANINFAARDGKIVKVFQMDTLRTTTLDGTGIGCNSIAVPLQRDLVDYTERLTSRLRYTGVGLCQFFVDPDDGSTTFLELNPRVSGSGALGFTLGFDLPLLALELASGHLIDEKGAENDYATGRQTSSIHADLATMRDTYRGGEISLREAAAWFGTAWATFFRADIDTTWSWRDPMPGLQGFGFPGRRRRAGSN
jgi:carbamoylphosphate synthase large subunit